MNDIATLYHELELENFVITFWLPPAFCFNNLIETWATVDILLITACWGLAFWYCLTGCSSLTTFPVVGQILQFLVSVSWVSLVHGSGGGSEWWWVGGDQGLWWWWLVGFLLARFDSDNSWSDCPIVPFIGMGGQLSSSARFAIVSSWCMSDRSWTKVMS